MSAFTRLRISERYRAIGRVRMAERLARESRWCRHVEDEAGARFDWVWVCSRPAHGRSGSRCRTGPSRQNPLRPELRPSDNVAVRD